MTASNGFSGISFLGGLIQYISFIEPEVLAGDQLYFIQHRGFGVAEVVEDHDIIPALSSIYAGMAAYVACPSGYQYWTCGLPPCDGLPIIPFEYVRRSVSRRK
jgi:hypothetical protein